MGRRPTFDRFFRQIRGHESQNAPLFTPSLPLLGSRGDFFSTHLGPEFFEENVGHFWGIVETRPYMRARLGLAFTLWGTGERDAAIEQAQDMLRLNPGDNQGVRYPLMLWLLETERH